MTAKLRFRDGFDWKRVAWGRPDSPVRDLCAYCHGKLPEVPLMLWNDEGYCISFCDDCVEKWIGSEDIE
jgi:hypothetical protein